MAKRWVVLLLLGWTLSLFQACGGGGGAVGHGGASSKGQSPGGDSSGAMNDGHAGDPSHGGDAAGSGQGLEHGPHVVGGQLSGLLSGAAIVLQNNLDDDLILTSDGAFSFKTPLAEGAAFSISVKTPPAGETCSIEHGEGVVGAQPVTDVVVTCGEPTFAVGGHVTGLTGGVKLVLSNNGTDELTLNADGAFAFATKLPASAAYAVAVATQPEGLTCTVSSGTGFLPVADIDSVVVTCSTATLTIGGTVSGLGQGKSLSLQNNATDDLMLSANGDFTFPSAVAYGSGYVVTVKTQPVGQTCVVSGGTGKATGSKVTSIQIACTTNSYTIGGTLTGLIAGKTVVLANNGGNNLTLTGNGSFTFSTPVASGEAYAVTLVSGAANQTCTVSSGAGTVLASNVVSVVVTCSAKAYVLKGTLSGLPAGKSVRILDNGGDAMTLNADGDFVFSKPLADGSPYSVTVGVQPTAATCSVSNAAGMVAGADITDVQVNCSINSYGVGGNLYNLAAGKAIILRNNGADDLTVSANGAFTFATPVASGSAYSVTVQTQPVGQTCSVTNGTGTIGASNINNVIVSCTYLKYKIGGTISGLKPSTSVYLKVVGSVTYAFSTNGAFTMPGDAIDGTAYSIVVATQSFGLLCTIKNGTGVVAAADVTNLEVDCVPAHMLGGTVQTLAAGKSVEIQNNGADNKLFTGLIGTQSFSFTTPVADGQPYAVTILNQPSAGQTCTVKNGTGTMNGADINTVQVRCTQLNLTILASSYPSYGPTALLFSGSTLIAGSSSSLLDSAGTGTFLLTDASSTMSGVSFKFASPAALLDGSYTLFVQLAKTSNLLGANLGEIAGYFANIDIAGPTTVTLNNADFKPYVSFGLDFSGETSAANMRYFCAPHLPGGNMFLDAAQRNYMGIVTGTTDATGKATIIKSLVAQGSFDYSCFADDLRAQVGGQELQPYNLQTGKGVDSGFDQVASLANVSVQAAGTTPITGFAPADFSTGTVACAGTYVSGGDGTPGTASFNGNNNSALLSGTTPASCSAGASVGTHKSITLEGPSGGATSRYTFGTPMLKKGTGDDFLMIAPFTNGSGAVQGGISVAANSVAFKDGGGATIVSTAPFVRIAAANCTSGAASFAACLGVSEVGYLVISATTGYAVCNSATFAIEDSPAAITGLKAEVIPRSFTRYSDGELRVRLTNQGLGNAYLGGSSHLLIALDADDNPTDFKLVGGGYVDHIFPTNFVAGTTGPKNSLVGITAPNLTIDSQSARIKIFAGFSDTNQAPN